VFPIENLIAEQDLASIAALVDRDLRPTSCVVYIRVQNDHIAGKRPIHGLVMTFSVLSPDGLNVLIGTNLFVPSHQRDSQLARCRYDHAVGRVLMKLAR
jgi:hypothetical protein